MGAIFIMPNMRDNDWRLFLWCARYTNFPNMRITRNACDIQIRNYRYFRLICHDVWIVTYWRFSSSDISARTSGEGISFDVSYLSSTIWMFRKGVINLLSKSQIRQTVSHVLLQVTIDFRINFRCSPLIPIDISSASSLLFPVLVPLIALASLDKQGFARYFFGVSLC